MIRFCFTVVALVFGGGTKVVQSSVLKVNLYLYPDQFLQAVGSEAKNKVISKSNGNKVSLMVAGLTLCDRISTSTIQNDCEVEPLFIQIE